MNYIELFAGCGGLSLGLESIEGSYMVMANELSPMPAETFVYNFFNEDLSQEKLMPLRTKWLSSSFPVTDLPKRLREDPRSYPDLNSKQSYSDITNSDDLKGNLVVGNIIHLNEYLESNPEVVHKLRNSYGNGDLDFVSGGPPCQSFSMAGMRKKNCDKNSLPWEFANFVSKVKPKFAILENVTGILRAFQDGGENYYAWIEVSKAFSQIGYIPLCLHVNAKYVGIPQNRPRFIMIGVREDIFERLSATFNSAEKELFSSSLSFYQGTKYVTEGSDTQLKYHDVVCPNGLKLFQDSFLSELVTHTESFISVSEAIDDLRFNGSNAKPSKHIKSNYLKLMRETYKEPAMQYNHEERRNGEHVQRRFRLYQIMQLVGKGLAKEVKAVLKGASLDISHAVWEEFSQYDYLVDGGVYIKFNSKAEFLDFLINHQTKKQTQKALVANNPAPAALSIPDDACHYHHDELRTLTVREMARIQSFPDSFVFRSKVTTGGQMRKFEVPQYTQVGNAVPPLLGRALGLSIKELLSRL
ncbi:DNA cytosine methyltransferase [Pseudoalteromonas rubra]|uniref:Cytosine-specific methyltransferase n=1 Tax=Pseudoalteromonas rubra TaxID=43658 RepID=A0A5S3WU08_9GAMM|nr:DNA cytosine methyltransferase [Pseudoalteromonas rubra]TMP32249.1 DNA (cytosine-5-)-methyltransferase [Pseudoalteromonas rubra]